MIVAFTKRVEPNTNDKRKHTSLRLSSIQNPPSFQVVWSNYLGWATRTQVRLLTQVKRI